MTAAALGTTLELDTFDGPRDLDDPAAAPRPATSITLRGLGVTHLRGTGRGDLVVHAMVQTPTRLDAEQEELLRQLAAAARRGAPGGPARQPRQGRLRQAARRLQGKYRQ